MRLLTNDRWRVPFYAHTFLVQAITFVLRPTAIYQALVLDVPNQWLGAIGASFAIVPLVLAVPSGHAADRFGESRVMAIGAVLTLCSAASFLILSDAVWGVLLASVLLGTGHLGSVVAQQALVANRIPAERYDTAFGHYTFVTSAGQAVGPLLLVAFGGERAIPDTSAIFACTATLAVVLLAVSFAFPRSTSAARETRRASVNAGSVRDLLRRPGLIRALTVSCVVLAAVDISLAYLPALGTERGISASVIGSLLALRAAASMSSRLFLGKLSAWLGRSRLLTSSIGFAAASVALIAVPVPVPALAAFVVLAGLGLGVGQPLTMSWLAEATPAGLRGRAMSLRLTGNRLGQVVVPTAAGAVAVAAGAGGVLLATAAALALAGVASRGIAASSPPAT